jgi:ADP-glucose pyrophosphorylase
MHTFALILCEIGLPDNIPGFTAGYPAGGLPFWGNYHVIDVICANFSEWQGLSTYIYTPEDTREQTDGPGGCRPDAVRIEVPAGGSAQFFTESLREVPRDFLILSGMSFVSLFNADEFLRIHETLAFDIVKISVDHTPLDLFIVRKERLCELLEKQNSVPASEPHFLRALFRRVLHHSFEQIEDIPGKVFFHYNLMQYFRENLNYIDYSCDQAFFKGLSRFHAPAQDLKESYIGSGGSVKNSFISQGVEVYGTVENSILFPNVSVKKNTHIINSVILNNNRIGSNTLIKNTLILPNTKADPVMTSNIEDNCRIGEDSPSIKNKAFPDQVSHGVTALGMNTRIPKGYNIEPACFIAADVPPARVKQYEKLHKGESIVNG